MPQRGRRPIGVRPRLQDGGQGLGLQSRRSPDWIKSKNPACEAVRREAEEDWGPNYMERI